MKNNDQNISLNPEILFEVSCLGCGKTVFNLPFIKDSHHSMTCHECGEVTITHILIDGSMAMGTAKQKEEALEKFINQTSESIIGFKSYDYDNRKINFTWKKNKSSIIHDDQVLKIIFAISCAGLKVTVESSISYFYNKSYYKLPNWNEAKFGGLLEIGALKTEKNGK